MNPLVRARLFGVSGAMEDPAALVIAGVLAGVLVIAGIAIAALSGTHAVGTELRKELWQRYIAWLIIAPFVVIPILVGPAFTIAMIFTLSVLCYREFARATGLFREKLMSAMVVLGIIAITFASLDHWYGFFAALSPLTITTIAAAALIADRPRGYLQRVGLSWIAFLLFGVCLGHLSFFANDLRYRAVLLLLLTTVALNDVFAYCVGKTIGGPKLVPNTSPRKTISGSLGALVLSTALFWTLGRYCFRGIELEGWYHLLPMGALVSIAGQCGDLMISSVKRDVGIKDMGATIPGHGGVLDRCNSLLLVAPALFHYINYFHGIGEGLPTRILSGH